MTEEIQETREAETTTQSENLFRRGLLYMLLASTAYYFASGSSGFAMPVDIPNLVAQAWIPLFFLGGLGFTLFVYFHPASSANREKVLAQG